MNILIAIIKRTDVRKVDKRAVKKAVDKYREKNRAIIMKKVKDL